MYKLIYKYKFLTTFYEFYWKLTWMQIRIPFVFNPIEYPQDISQISFIILAVRFPFLAHNNKSNKTGLQ